MSNNIETSLVFVKDTEGLDDSSIKNGSVIFNESNKNIYLKWDDNVTLYTEKNDANVYLPDNQKEKLIEIIYNYTKTGNSEGNIVNLNDEELQKLKEILNKYQLGDEDIPGVTPQPDPLDDESIIGVACTGEYTEAGATLAWIDNNFNEITNLSTDFFNNHKCFKFEEVLFSSDEMIKIPLAYWWRGTIPSGPYQGKWGMLMSPKEATINGTKMKPNYVAFMNKGTLKDCFYYSKYRASKVGSLPVSVASIDWNEISMIDARKYTANKGTGWHVTTIQEYHEILARQVIENRTFQLTPDNKKTNASLSQYRGIQEHCYNNGTVYMDFLDGIQIPMGSNIKYQVFDNNGNRTWVNTNFVGGYPFRYIGTIVSDNYFDNMFFADNGDFSSPSATKPQLIPDLQWQAASSTTFTTVYCTYLSYSGAFSLCNYADTTDAKFIGFRISRIL